VITQCSIRELYANGDQAPIALAKTCERRRCGHIEEALSSHDCITECINISGENKHRYILATQDEHLRGKMRRIPAVPMVYIRRAVMIMEPPSSATVERREILEREKLGGLEGAAKRKREGEGDQPAKKKKKGRKEPNPLSVKKKKSIRQERTSVEPDKMEGEESNVIGEATDSIRRSTSRHRRRHKKPQAQETIPSEAES
jgi:U3 small nucleolar RNA-associated protein 23